MGDTLTGFKDLKIRNVSLHSRGKTENGTLYLARHHLVFSYLPNAGAGTSTPHTLNVKSSSNGTTSSPAPSLRQGFSSDGTASHRESSEGLAAKATTATPRGRPREIWVPYPMINHCHFRPSHGHGRTYAQEAYAEDNDDLDESAFPPVFGTSAYARPSTDSAPLAPYPSPQRPASPANNSDGTHANDHGRSPAIRIRKRDFQMMAFHLHPSTSNQSPDDIGREIFYCLRTRCCVDSVQDMHAFHFKAPQQEAMVGAAPFDARREFSRMGIGGKAAEGPGSAWRITDINSNYEYSPTYPSVLCVPRTVSDNILKYGGAYRSKSRIPALTYLHSNGGSITRSSQPMCGIQSKRNAQDERLISAIFSSHSPLQHHSSDKPSQLLTTSSAVSIATDMSAEVSSIRGVGGQDDDLSLGEISGDDQETLRPRVYGSTRRNLIVDARPKMNALANRATGGGIEDVANYNGPPGTMVERVFLNIANIHAMRKSLDKIVESFANSDYLDMRPNQELLRNSGWLAHIANMLAGAESVARIVGLGGSHVLVHCSDGWDRTSQVAALAELMLDPYYRTLQGFITLVQKDFLSFGHKFNHRHGIQGSEKWFYIENERVAPSRAKDTGNTDTKGLNAIGSKALSGAKNWFDKNRGSLFGQQLDGKSDAGSRPSSPPPNTLMHSTPTASTERDREHRTDTKEIAPILHQFLDAVFQLQYQFPTAFEFNERFLRRLFYQAHSGQYGEFLFNNEKDRREHENKFPSVWAHFLSRRAEFTNPEYVSKAEDPLLLPRRQAGEVEVRWWSALFGRKDEEMNAPRALARTDSGANDGMSRLSLQASTVSLNDGTIISSDRIEPRAVNESAIKEVKSAPSYDNMGIGLLPDFTSLQTGPSETREERYAAASIASSSEKAVRPVLESWDTDATVLAKYAAISESSRASTTGSSCIALNDHMDVEEGDPLGVSTNTVPQSSNSRLDPAILPQ
ncbi:hypothetical protein DOTSEDRAFT_40569 [Dothistroma septosporum NZE10]|uniref:Myotubularin phosphatase domain-containing protein n=1 Tax=Dothistroma septosporum (strain NZE10 / CBS 128990) TaxID=675120 RepID=N1Q257_DOTSN|nr:hypothetical protein DOTSEDRAFT_40569 [Dothistroma septosporum NZE10]